MLRIGVLGLQGDVSEHVRAMQRALDGRGEVALVRSAGIIPDCDGLAIPGGESTTLSKLIAGSGIDDEIKKAAAAGSPILATCAGLVLVSGKIQGDDRVNRSA